MINLHPKKSKKRFWLILMFLILGFILGCVIYFLYKNYYGEITIPQIIKTTPSEKTAISPLDGTKVTPDQATVHPLAIVIENHTDARPQSGLDKASIVYEAISEGGITRFMAIYGPNSSDKVGPVRSARTFFLDWAAEYNAFFAHVGGNIDALDRIGPEKVLDLDQFGVGDKAYWRIPDPSKALEHTMYTSIPKLYQVAKDKGWDMKSNFTSLKFIDPKKFTINQDISQKITIDFSSKQYKVSYAYDPKNNNYPRILAGFAAKDASTGNQLAPTNIIIQEVERTAGLTRINEDSWTMKTVGEGKAYVIYGGQKIDATWKKTDLKSRTKFYDANGKEISYLPGQFWYEIVPPEVFDKVSISSEAITHAQ